MSDESSLFRSEKMSLIQLYIPSEIGPQTVAELGEIGRVQFNDLNPSVNAFQRTYVAEIKRLNEMERKQRFIKAQATKSEVEVSPADPLASYASVRSLVQIDSLESTLGELEVKMIQMNSSEETLNKRYLELSELKHVLRETAVFFQEAEHISNELLSGAGATEDSNLLASVDRNSAESDRNRFVNIGFVTGVIPRAKMATFELIVFRALRGNVYINHAQIADAIVDPSTDTSTFKNVFLVVAHGRENMTKIKKITESMGATLYPVDENPDRRRENGVEVLSRLEDLKHVLDNTKRAKRTELERVAESIDEWAVVLKKEKAIFHTMNLFNYDAGRKALMAVGWCPSNAVGEVQFALRTVTERTGSTIPPLLSEVPTQRTPPTYHRTNKFSAAFQEIVDAYGIATYAEVNPGLFTTITFPFLFAVMFGDFGHGILLSSMAIWMVQNEKWLGKKKWGEIWTMVFGGRYIILLMGLFSVYTGLIYNDMFSLPLKLMASAYTYEHDPITGHYFGVKDPTRTYGIGLDPAWHGTENMLVFTNSYKMKMSIVFGVFHMSFGIALQVYNHIKFNRKISIYAEFLPQILFFWSIFGYLVFMIVFKWFKVFEDPSTAPSLLNTLIAMFLSPGTVTEPLYSGQGPIQAFLLLLAFITIPWMLLAKPYYLYMEHKKTAGAGYVNAQRDHDHESVPIEGSQVDLIGVGADEEEGDSHGSGEFEFGDIMIHQMIHTIEFTLSGISNTASYLRLWALSLAHAQLSEVVWSMILGSALNSANALFIVFGYFMWINATVGILMGMEGMSAFLHALRLHWVEFQNKFYEGKGRKFMPFAFAVLFTDIDE